MCILIKLVRKHHWEIERKWLIFCDRTVSMATYCLYWVAIVHMSHVTRKPFLRVCDQVILKPACWDIEACKFEDIDLILNITPAAWMSYFDQNRFSAPYLLNKMMDSDQFYDCIVSLGKWKDLIKVWWPWPYFQGHHTIKTVKVSLVCILSPEPIDGFWPNLHIKFLWYKRKKCLDFGDLGLIFKVTSVLWM